MRQYLATAQTLMAVERERERERERGIFTQRGICSTSHVCKLLSRKCSSLYVEATAYNMWKGKKYCFI